MANKNKKAKNNSKNSSFPQRGEIWIVDYNYKPPKEEIDKNDFMIENDIKKHRPSLVLSNNTQNKYDEEIHSKGDHYSDWILDATRLEIVSSVLSHLSHCFAKQEQSN